VKTVAKKVAGSAVPLARLMPNFSGAEQWKRRLLGSVVESQLLRKRGEDSASGRYRR